MKQINLGNGALRASAIALGCMRMADLPHKDAERVVKSALEAGIDFFDHADIYGGGKSEEVFAKAIDMRPSVRETIWLQSKCGIRQGFFDFSKEHILTAVDGILSRLKTDYLDVLLLHRPDTLVEPEEVAEAFSALHRAGKVRHFGVSNQNPMQMALLQKHVQQKLIVNQLQLSITNTGMIDSGLNVNMQIDRSIDRDGGILDYCRLHDITIQPWSPFQYGFFEGAFLDNPKFPELNGVMDRIAQEKGVSNSAIAIAWLLRHPANMQPIIGSMNPERIGAIAKAAEVTLTRPEWYEIYRAAGNTLP
jgi:predicted oxidoreductase